MDKETPPMIVPDIEFDQKELEEKYLAEARKIQVSNKVISPRPGLNVMGKFAIDEFIPLKGIRFAVVMIHPEGIVLRAVDLTHKAKKALEKAQ